MTIAMIPVMGLSMFASSASMAFAATPAEKTAQHQENFFQKEASLLGLSLDEVKGAWAEGKRLLELAADHGISKDALKARIQAQAKAHVDERMDTLVERGVITRAQADKRKEAMNEKIENGKGKHPFRRIFHGRK